MKPFLFILISFVSLTFFQPLKAADTVDKVFDKTGAIIDSTTNAVEDGIAYVDTSSTYKILYSDIKSGITALASSLKVGAEHVYGILVKQQLVNAITFLILLIFGIILLLNFTKALKNPNEQWETREFLTSLGIARVLQAILCCILLLIALLNIDVIVMGFINPEYGAIKEILTIVSGKPCNC